MSLSQPKIDLAVLYKLHQHAEANGDLLTPEDVQNLFQIPISLRRVELALEALEGRREVEKVYHPHHFEEGLWRVTREGMSRIDRALRVQVSFAARLHASGDSWLQSDEAQQAVLKNLQEAAEPLSKPDHTILTSSPAAVIAGAHVDWAKWGAIASIIAIPVAFVIWWLS